MKMIGNVSDWLSCAGGALIKVADSAGSTVFLLFPRMKKIQSKMKLLEWPQHFPHYNSMRAICCHGNQSSDATWPKT